MRALLVRLNTANDRLLKPPSNNIFESYDRNTAQDSQTFAPLLAMVRAWALPECLAKLRKPRHLSWSAEVEMFGVGAQRSLIGYIAIARNSHILQLFVRADSQQKGISRMLIDFVEDRIKAIGITQLTVRASLNAVPFYERCGFEVNAEPQEKSGIRFQPMQKTF